MAALPPVDDTAEALDLTVRGLLFCLRREQGRLTLSAPHLAGYGSMTLDWTDHDQQRRQAGGRKQLLPKALGLAKRADLRILDGTAGLGRDGFLLASLGATVTLVERHPVLAALQRDALRRALAHPATAAAATRVSLCEADSAVALAAAAGFDAIYLDPMYPDDGKRALPSKEMQILRDLTGGDADADALLPMAIGSDCRRVVVKRPAKAPWLAQHKPSLSLTGTQARFDIYLTT